MPEEYEDVEATLEQGTTPDPSQKEKRRGRFVGWLKTRPINKIVGSTLIFETLWVALFWFIPQVLHWWSWNSIVSAEHFVQFYFAWGLGILSLGYIVLILWPIFKKDDDPRWFHARILSSGIVGGAYAFLLPVVMSLPEGNVNSGGAAALRQAILLATGGLIALIALGETRRKNDNDREAAENLRIHQQDTLDQQKDQFEKQLEKQQEQFDANAFKDRKAERRERYTKAVEQLGDEKAPVRMGGVYTLVGLVDEWLEEESIRKYEDRLKEGQVIINNLCAYIRSPFTLASHYDELMQDTPDAEGVYQDKVQEFYADKATLDSETDVRLSIIKEIHDRLQGSGKNTPGAWSDFEYDFSGSTFFYPIDLTNSYYAKPINFSGSTYKGWANFSNSTYKGETYFTDSTYKDVADFSRSTYQALADFSRSTYQALADFSRSTYQGGVDFTDSTYQALADFTDSTYQALAYFSRSTYQALAYFSRSTYQALVDFTDSTYQALVDFTDSTYQALAYFSRSTYEGGAYFHGSTYEGGAYFSRSTYRGGAHFAISTYNDVADFSGSIFYQKVYFGADGDNNSFSRFTDCAPQFYDETNRKNTLFGSPDNDFTVDTSEGYPINLNSEGLPLGCKFLTSEQKEYLADKFQEIDETNNKLREVKDPKEKEELLKKLQALNEELHKWREEVTTVKVEGTALGEDDN